MSIAVGAVRIGAVARRPGASPELLRAWERRYGLLQPIRTEGGFRLYTDEDGAPLEPREEALRRLRHCAPLVLSGAGASDELCARLRIDRLDGDLVAAARVVSGSVPMVEPR